MTNIDNGCGITEEENAMPWENNNLVSNVEDHAEHSGIKDYEEEYNGNVPNIDEV